ncbi:hypothetical protein [Streptomonospora alba]|uniref:hypothetical protein n=1 Tax=Streptomonospora alba TaxID=183763 RepID=UPI0012EEC809|nr:hypothetical protein [Streptomonospora alba]
MTYPQDPGRPQQPGPQGPWQQQPPGPGGPRGPQYPGQQPPGGGGPGYGTPPGPPPGGSPGTPGSPYPPPPGGRPPEGGGNAGLVLVIISVCLAILVVIGGVGVWWLFADSGGSSGSVKQQGADGSVKALYEGTWDGTLEQYDADGNAMGTWSVTIEVGEETISAEEYGLDGPDDSRCTWEIPNAQGSESQLTFSYSVSGDPDCADSGDVTIEPAGEDSLDITVTGTLSDGSESESRGTLHRQ